MPVSDEVRYLRQRGTIVSAIARAQEMIRTTTWPRDKRKLQVKIERLTALLAEMPLPR